MISISRWAESKVGFYVDRQWLAGRWVHGWEPIRLAPYHKDILEHIFTPDEEGRYLYSTVAWCEPAKSGKSAIAALCAQFVGLHVGQNSSVVLASNKQKQAQSVMYKSLVDSVTHNPVLQVEPSRLEVEFPSSGNRVVAIPSSARSEAGARYSLFCVDEPWGYVHTDAVRLFSEFKSDPTRTLSLKLAIGYAGYDGESRLWQELLDNGIQGEPVLTHITNEDGEPACFARGDQFTFWSDRCRQGWQTPQWIESQRQALRGGEFARMIQCRFVAGEGNFCEPDVWAACINPDHRPLEPGSKEPVFVGVDLAIAAGGDNAAIVGVYPQGGRVKLAFHRVWEGSQRKNALRLGQTVKPFLLQVARDYDLQSCYFDPWQAQRLMEELRAEGIQCVEVVQSHSSRAPRDTWLWEAVHDGRLVLYDHPQIRGAASGAIARELGTGQIFLSKRSRAKIDALVALSNCASAASSGTHRPTIALVSLDSLGQPAMTGRSMMERSLLHGMRGPGVLELVRDYEQTELQRKYRESPYHVG